MRSSRAHTSGLTVGAIAAVAAAALLLAACGDDDDEPAAATVTAAEVDGREFTSTSVTGAELVPDSHVGLSFWDGHLAAFAGCNTLNGAFEIDGARLVVGDALAATLMLCDEAHTQQDAWLAELISAGPTISLDGDQLTLTHADVTMVFTDPQGRALQLAGATWWVEQFEVAGAPLEVPAAAAISFTDSTANVATGCNSAFGAVEIGDTTVRFDLTGQTMMACAGELQTFESALLGFLQNELTYTIDDRVATLTDGSSVLTVKLPYEPEAPGS